MRSVIGYRTFVVDARVEAEEGVTSADALRRAAAEASARDDEGARSRCTIAFGDPSALQHVLGVFKSELAKFDVLALEPTSERAFASACASKHADIVSVRAGGKLGYRFAASDVRAALKNKIWFELCYGEALRDSTSRMWFFANAGALAESDARRSRRRHFIERRRTRDRRAFDARRGEFSDSIRHARKRRARGDDDATVRDDCVGGKTSSRRVRHLALRSCVRVRVRV